MLQLKNIDDVSYVRFNRFYRRFKDINLYGRVEFMLKGTAHDEQH
jgi:transcriptional regulator NrdR family protein